MMAGIGAHEVIIESPDHHMSMATLPEDNIREVLWVYRDRLVDLKKDTRLVHGMLFKNVGAAGGASLEHTHSQLIVTPIVPISVWEEMTGSLEFFNYRGRCIYCDMVQQELAAEKRIVLDSPHFTAFCPFASRFPFETWIVPKTHSSHFENIPKPGVDDLGHVLHQVLNKLELALDSPAYNYIIHTAPFDHGELPHYHWHIEIIPRLTKVAGFEWGSGFYINPVPPENAAGFLREVEVSRPPSRPVRARGERPRRNRHGLERRDRSRDSPRPRIRRVAADVAFATAVNPEERPSMSQVRLILALAQPPAGRQFRRRLRGRLSDSYLPFLDVLEGYPEIPFVLHTSGPLLEWLVEQHPEYIARLRRMVEAGRVEILGGGFFEPILTMIPHRDRVGQIRGYSRLPRGDSSAPGSAGCGSPSGSGSSTWSRRSPRPASSTRSSTTSTSSAPAAPTTTSSATT